MFNVSFAALEHAFDAAGAALSVAESHGCLAGALCAQDVYSVEQWMEEVLPDTPAETSDPSSDPVREPMTVVFTDTVRALRSDDMEFAPLLPDDEAPLAARAEALAQWSQGFLYGFGMGGRVQDEESPSNIDEVLRDFAEIARASSKDLSGSEEEEQAYSELVEYVRAGAQLVHDELIAQRRTQIH